MVDSYTLYYFPFSLYSLMSRLGLELAASLDPASAPKYQIKLVNLHEDGEIAEEYLTKVNSRGTVPSLSSPVLAAPMTDSRDIARWLCEKQPELLPSSQKETIERLMDLLYNFHAKALCTPEEQRIHGVPNYAAAKLESKDISESYRRALEIKSVFHDQMKGRAFEPENVTATEEACMRFSDFLTDVMLSQKQREGYEEGPWVFGARPTIIDAHAAPLLARLLDVQRPEFVKGILRDYVEGVKKTEAWQRTTKGRPTSYTRSLGPVKDMEL